MIVGADFFGFIDGRHLTWLLTVSDGEATVDATWNPPLPTRTSAAVTFKWPESETPPSFMQLQRRYPSPMEGASVRGLSFSVDGVLSHCVVHGDPSLIDHPELAAFNDVWRRVSRLVQSELTAHLGS